MINYFEKERLRSHTFTVEGAGAQEYVEIQRLGISEELYATLDSGYWEGEQTRLSKRLTVDHLARMEDHDDTVVIDFANAFIGGGALKRGSAQEEILFLIYPQLHVAVLVCEKMDYNEVISLVNFRRFAHYEGFHKTLKFVKAADVGEQRRDFIAMDALKFGSGGKKNEHATEVIAAEEQFHMSNVLRELNKALIGFTLAPESRFKVISTGKWGCGAFGGDPQLKFLVQWMAVTVAGHPMIFHTFQDNDRLEDLAEVSTRYLNGKTVGELYNYIKKYSKG